MYLFIKGQGSTQEGRVIRLIEKHVCTAKSTYTIPTYRRAHTQTHTQRNGPNVVFIIPSAQREDELRDEKIAGYLAAPRGSTSAPSGSTRQPDADHASHKTSREPEHASDEMHFTQPREMRVPLRAPADPHVLCQILTLPLILTLWPIPSLSRSLRS